MDNFSLLRPKLTCHEGPIIHRPTYPGMMMNMEDKNENKEWNARWFKQITLWHAEAKDLISQAEARQWRADQVGKVADQTRPSRVIGLDAV